MLCVTWLRVAEYSGLTGKKGTALRSGHERTVVLSCQPHWEKQMDIYKQDKYKQTNSDVVALRFQRVRIYPLPSRSVCVYVCVWPLPRSQPCLPSESQSATQHATSSPQQPGTGVERAREREEEERIPAALPCSRSLSPSFPFGVSLPPFSTSWLHCWSPSIASVYTQHTDHCVSRDTDTTVPTPPERSITTLGKEWEAGKVGTGTDGGLRLTCIIFSTVTSSYTSIASSSNKRLFNCIHTHTHRQTHQYVVLKFRHRGKHKITAKTEHTHNRKTSVRRQNKATCSNKALNKDKMQAKGIQSIC